MTLTYRNQKGSALTCTELDQNFAHLLQRENHLGTQPSSSISDFSGTVVNILQNNALIAGTLSVTQAINGLRTDVNTLQNSNADLFRGWLNEHEADNQSYFTWVEQQLGLQWNRENNEAVDISDSFPLSLSARMDSLQSDVSAITGLDIPNNFARVFSPVFTGTPRMSSTWLPPTTGDTGVISRGSQLATLDYVREAFPESTVLYVSTNGDDSSSNDGKSPLKPFKTIKRAAEAAQVGWTIEIEPGDYSENNPITLKSFVGLIGDNLRRVNIYAANLDEDVIKVNGGCYLTGITFRNHGYTGSNPNYAVSLVDNAYITISPYIYNCSSITNLGGGTLHVDGDKIVANSPLRSALAAQFTAVNSLPNVVNGVYQANVKNGPGYLVENDAYAQLVSVYTNFATVGIETRNGGQIGLSNSNCSFGLTGLKAVGFNSTPYRTASSTASISLQTATGAITAITISSNILSEVKFNSTNTDITVGSLITLTSSGGSLVGPFYIRTLSKAGSTYTAEVAISETDFNYPNVTGHSFAVGNAVSVVIRPVQSSLTVTLNVDQARLPYQTSKVTIREPGVGGVMNVIGGDFEVISYTTTTGNTGVLTFRPGLSSLASGATFEFNERSVITTSVHNFEYVGSGCDYRALPENGGVPAPSNEVVELNGGRVYYASINHQGDFKVGNIFQARQSSNELSITTDNFNLAGLTGLGPFKRNGVFVGTVLKEFNNAPAWGSIAPDDDTTAVSKRAIQEYVTERIDELSEDPFESVSLTTTKKGSLANLAFKVKDEVNAGKILGGIYGTNGSLNLAVTGITGSSPTDAIRILNDGSIKVGINKTNPITTLDVNGSISSSNYGTNSTTNFSAASSGNYLLGTVSSVEGHLSLKAVLSGSVVINSVSTLVDVEVELTAYLNSNRFSVLNCSRSDGAMPRTARIEITTETTGGSTLKRIYLILEGSARGQVHVYGSVTGSQVSQPPSSGLISGTYSFDTSSSIATYSSYVGKASLKDDSHAVTKNLGTNDTHIATTAFVNSSVTSALSQPFVATLSNGSTAITQPVSANNTTIATTEFVKLVQQTLYPVGSLYFNATSATNPSQLMGFGTWDRYAQGRVLVGEGSGSDGVTGKTFAIGSTGGSYNRILTTAQMPAHAHSVSDPGHNHSVTDTGHSHTISQTAHSHAVTDPGHGHTLTDPGHAHDITDPGHRHSLGPSATSTGNPTTVNENGSNAIEVELFTRDATTGISIESASTGITLANQVTGLTLGSASAAITVNSGSTGVSIQNKVTGITLANESTGLTLGSASAAITVNSGSTGITLANRVTGLTLGSASAAITVNSGSTGITLADRVTGLTLGSASAAITVNSGSTGISIQDKVTGLTVQSSGSGQAFSIEQPFVTVYIWRRTA